MDPSEVSHPDSLRATCEGCGETVRFVAVNAKPAEKQAYYAHDGDCDHIIALCLDP
jgi:hypothetical protein